MIKSIGATVVENYELKGNDLTLYRPVGLKVLKRPAVLPGIIRLGPWYAVVTLWGGRPGEALTISGGLRYPPGASAGEEPFPGGIVNQQQTWPDVDLFSAVIPFDFTVVHTEDRGTGYHLILLANGEGIADIVLPVVYRDELPRVSFDSRLSET